MPPDQETSISQEISQPTPTPEPTEPTPILPSTSSEMTTAPVAPEAPPWAESAVPVTLESTLPQAETASNGINQSDNSASSPESQTAQVVVNEPFDSTHDKPFAKLTLLAKAREMIQFRKRKKLEKIMGMFLKQSSITNDEVEKLLHVSDATATRYLSQLEKEGKIKQEGRTGKGVSYSRM